MKSTLTQDTILQGRYKVISKIATAGQSNIYKVIDVEGAGCQTLALKEMIETLTTPQEREQAREQFHQQARILSGLSHQNLPRIIASFSEQGKDYLAMEFVHGSTLEQILYTTPGFLEEHRVITWAVQLCDALDYLHSQKNPVIFRDIKPANIMLDARDTIKLVDFGIARIFNPQKRTDTLKMGTLGYAPPEQYKGRGQTDERSDIYALGATMHHLLTKRDPQDEPPFSFSQAKPRDIRPELSLGIEKVVMKAVEYDKSIRQSSAREFKAELLACSSIVVRPTCSSINTEGTQACVKDGTLLTMWEGINPSPTVELGQAEVPPRLYGQVSKSTSTPSATGDISCGQGFNGENPPYHCFLLKLFPEKLEREIARGLVWMYSIIAGMILGIISCPLIIVASLIEGALKGIVIGVLIGGLGILISRALVNTYSTFTRPETWVLVGIGVVILSTIVNPMANLINAHGASSFYRKHLHHSHGRYAAAVGLLAALSAIACPAFKHMGKVVPLVTRYMERVWNFLISYV